MKKKIYEVWGRAGECDLYYEVQASNKIEARRKATQKSLLDSPTGFRIIGNPIEIRSI